MTNKLYTPLDAAKEHLRKQKTQGSDPFEVASATALLEGYDLYHPNDKFEVVSVESVKSMNIPETSFKLSGRFDTMLRDQRGNLINLEHKTTNSALDNSFHPQLAKTSFDRQISLYHLLAFKNDEPLEETWLDVIRKVGIRPKGIPAGTANKTRGTKKEIASTKTYYGKDISQETLTSLFRTDKAIKENPELYGYRVSASIAENPDNHYKRKTQITRTVDEMKDMHRQLVQIAREIERAEEEGAWFQNTNSCFAYGSACAFWTLCSGTDTPDSETWMPRQGSAQSARFSLSHSRIGSFHGCRRKYYYTYVLGIQKAREEKSAALRYGSLVHDALEVYWLRQKEDQNGNFRTSED